MRSDWVWDIVNKPFWLCHELVYSVSWILLPECCVELVGANMCPTYWAIVCIGYVCRREFSSNCASWCTSRCTAWLQPTSLNSVSPLGWLMLVVVSDLRSAATSSLRDRRQSSVTAHSPSLVRRHGTVCRRMFGIPWRCLHSKPLWKLTCSFDCTRGCNDSSGLYGALESVYVLRRHRSCRDYYYYYYYCQQVDLMYNIENNMPKIIQRKVHVKRAIVKPNEGTQSFVQKVTLIN